MRGFYETPLNPVTRRKLGTEVMTWPSATFQASGRILRAHRYERETLSDTRPFSGLGQTARVDSIEVRWPSGQVQRLGDVPADRVVTVEEPR
jgi:hypothetical protein